MIKSRRIITQEEDQKKSCDTCRFLKSQKMKDNRVINSCGIDGSIHSGEIPLRLIICKKYKEEVKA